ncbi:MAG: Tetratricopeptide 2 repeat-containing protein [Flavipsychrobacter sp.]|jgi:tetratricopeptide (TPR) repeat protein|nr:Tetratricopeptide 2 repeat-containing protein [Flavipsychrobacter sp.]
MLLFRLWFYFYFWNMARETGHNPYKTGSVDLPPDMNKPGKGISVRKLCIFLAVISFAVYANTLQNGYVMDDITVTTGNTIVTQGFSGIPDLLFTTRLKGFQQGADAESYRPVPMITHAIEYQLFGDNAAVGHFFNIILFIGCVIALFVFLDKLFAHKRTGTAFTASLLFALHPIHTEVVANIKSRDELLCFLFAFISLNQFVNYANAGKTRQLIAGAICLALSLLSKETAISFIAIAPLVFFFYINANRKHSIVISVTTLLVALCYLGARGAVLGFDRENAITFIANPISGAPDIATRLATAFMVLGMYLKLLFVPYPLVSDYCYNTIPLVGFGNAWALLSAALYVALAGIGLYRLFKKPNDPWAFSILYFLVTIALFSNIPFLVYSQMAERFLFFASAGFCLAVALAVEQWMIKLPLTASFTKNKPALTTLSIVCLVFFVLTALRNTDWKDNYSLFKTDLEKVPDNARMHYYLANTIAYSTPGSTTGSTPTGKDADCIILLDKAVKIYPDFSEAHALMGIIYGRMQMPDSAIHHYSMAIAANPKNSIALYNLGIALYAKKSYPEAISFIKKSLSLNPDFVMGNLNLARCYSDSKQYDSAIVYYKRTLDLEPGLMLAKQGLNFVYKKKSEADTTGTH